jgi:4-amino-4-deoxy-L-arabinose transferase-like glycosyltransferase
MFRMPGYPVLLAPLFMICDDPPVWSGRVLGAVLGTAAVAGVGWLAAVCFDGRTALMAATLAAFYPGAVAMSVFLLSEAPFCPFMLWQLAAWANAWRAPVRRNAMGWSLSAGIAAGLATLMRPSWLLFTPFALVFPVVFSTQRARHALLGGIMLLACAAVMAPWWVRNYTLAGRFLPTTSETGSSLYDGLSPYATGESNFTPVDEFKLRWFHSLPPEQRPHGIELELAWDQQLRQAALEWAQTHPRRVLELAGAKFLRMWNVWPNADEFQSPRLRWIVALSYTPVLLLSLAGAWRFAPRGWPYVLCLLPAMYFTALHVIFVASIRYRDPAMLTLMILAAGVVTSWRRAGELSQAGALS